MLARGRPRPGKEFNKLEKIKLEYFYVKITIRSTSNFR